MIILSILLSLVFIGLALIHFNWVFGGNFGFEASLPTNKEGKRLLNPTKFDSAIVGIGLLFFGIFYIYQSGLIAENTTHWTFWYLGWLIPAIFLLRAIGEFKFIGFFKKIKDTAFGKLDTKFFSPLCLVIAVAGMLIQIFN